MTNWATPKDSTHGGGGQRKGEHETVAEGLKYQLQKQVLFLPVLLFPLYFSQYYVSVMLVTVTFNTWFPSCRLSTGSQWNSSRNWHPWESMDRELENVFLGAAVGDNFGRFPTTPHGRAECFCSWPIIQGHFWIIRKKRQVCECV